MGPESALLDSVRRLTLAAASGGWSFELSERIAEEVVAVLGADACALFRFDGDEVVMVGGRAARGQEMFVRGTRFALPDARISSEVRRTGGPVHMADYSDREGAGPRRVGELGYMTVIGAPLMVEDRLWGTVTAASGDPARLPPGSEQRLDVFAGLCAMAIALGEHLARLESQTAEQNALLAVSRRTLEAPDPDAVLAMVAEQATRLLGLTSAAVFRTTEGDGETMTLAAEWHAGDHAVPAGPDELAELVRASDAVIAIGDPDSTAAGDPRRGLGLPVAWGAPIRMEGRIWGAIVVAGELGLPVPQDAAQRLERFAELSGLAIARAESRAALDRQLVETEQFAALVELSDDFIAIATLEGRCLYVNRGGRRLLGLGSLEDARTHDIPDFLPPEAIAASIEVEQPAVREHGSWQGESSLRHFITGESIPVSINSFLVTHPVTGEPLVLATVQRDLRERKRAEEQLRERAGEVEQLAAARRFLLVETLRAEERLRRQIGDSLHDVVLQELLAARQDLVEAGEGGEPVARAREAVNAASTHLREVVHDLHPAVSWTRDLEERLRSILEQGAQRAGFAWTLDFELGEPDEVADLLLALLRELIQNVVKHAAASTVKVRVSDEDGALCLEVADDGRGMSPGRPGEALRDGHIGLASARERVDALGGRFEVVSSPGGGTRLRVVVPRTGFADLPGRGHVQ